MDIEVEVIPTTREVAMKLAVEELERSGGVIHSIELFRRLRRFFKEEYGINVKSAAFQTALEYLRDSKIVDFNRRTGLVVLVNWKPKPAEDKKIADLIIEELKSSPDGCIYAVGLYYQVATKYGKSHRSVSVVTNQLVTKGVLKRTGKLICLADAEVRKNE